MKAEATVIRTLRPDEVPPAGVAPSRYRNSEGYVRLRWRVGPRELVECYEHRWLANCLDPSLQVHHINGIKDDNRLENLAVVTPREHAAEHTSADLREIVRLYESGMSTPEVGRALGLDPSTVYRALCRAGFRPRSISESLRSDTPDDLIRRLHASGVRSRRIAKHLGLSPTLVDSRVRELGLTPHPPGRPSAADVRRAEQALKEIGA